jgi:hypothetical protein
MTKKYVIALFLIGLFSLSCFTLPVPKTINFQGKLISKADGNPITIPTDIKFLLYNHATNTGLAEQWFDTISATPDANGIFSVTLGPGGNIPLGNVDFNQALWLELQISMQTLAPRQPLSASPYAFYAVTAEVAVLAHTAETVLSSAPAGGWVDDGTVVSLATPSDKVSIEGNSYFGGRVGIGTTTPAAKLHVAGSGDTRIYVSGGAVTAELFSTTDTNTGYVGTLSNHPFALRTNDLNRITILADGKVGIGSNSPTSPLQVVNLPICDTLQQAKDAGLSAGAFYRTTAGQVMVVY